MRRVNLFVESLWLTERYIAFPESIYDANRKPENVTVVKRSRKLAPSPGPYRLFDVCKRRLVKD